MSQSAKDDVLNCLNVSYIISGVNLAGHLEGDEVSGLIFKSDLE